MKPLVWFLLLALGFTLRGEPPRSKAPSVPVLIVGQRTFLDAAVSKLDAFTARITHSTGAATVPAWEMSAAQQKSFGFDPRATAAERARRETARRTEEAAVAERDRLAIEHRQAQEDGWRALQAIADEKKLQAQRPPLKIVEIQDPEKMPLMGMTEEQAIKKYGRPIDQALTERWKTLLFAKKTIHIAAHFSKGRVIACSYVREDGREFAVDEVEVLLRNIRAQGWVFRGAMDGGKSDLWQTQDGSLSAINSAGKSLLNIVSEEAIRLNHGVGAADLKGL